MYEDHEEEPAERAFNVDDRVRDKSDEFRTHAELAAVFEAKRKFDAEIDVGLSAEIARDVQRAIGKLERAKAEGSPVLPAESAGDAAAVLDMPKSLGVTTNDYHVHRRPGEAMIVRWIAGAQVEQFYERVQAHFDAALEGYREDERQAKGWQQDPKTIAYLEALDKLEVKMAERYLRDPIKQFNLFVLSTQSADEMNIAYLCDYVMGVPAAEVVGLKNAPPDEAPTDRDLAWFFKLFSLRGVLEGEERMCFFAYLQKADADDFGDVDA